MSLIVVFVFVCVSLLLALILKIFHKLWWAPIRIQKLMNLQGIKGPSYRFFHGTSKEQLSMGKEARAKPIMGLSHNIFPKLQPHVHCWTKLYGKNYLQWFGPQAQMVITEPELIKEILNNKEKAYPKPKKSEFLQKIFGDGLSAAEGKKWVKKRKLANHAFHGESLKSMIPAMIESVESMLEKWKSHVGKEIDVYEQFRFLTAEVISKTAFGSSFLEGKTIFEMLEKLTLLATRNIYKPRFPGISKIFKTEDQIESDKLEKGICNSIMEMIKKREEKITNGDKDGLGNDFLGLLVKACHDANENQRISMDDVVDECKTFYFAGQETTNSLLAWTVFLLATHMDWQEEARKEVINLFGKQDPKPDGLAMLKTMSLIINESLRLYPPVVGLARKTDKEVRLGNLNLPADVYLALSILAVHHDPQVWGEDVHLFKPERFSEGVSKATKNNIASLFPFGLGPRTCVGFNFVLNEAKIALAMILQRYTFTLSPAYVHSPIVVITNRPQFGVQVRIHRI
ncbi:hypothetical protein UlMin_025897 [Ulmus minor]